MEQVGLHVKLGADNKELTQKLQESEREIGKAVGAVNGFADNIGVLRLRYRELSQTSMLGKTPEEIRKVEAEMATLRDQIGDYQARINSMSLDPFQKGAQAIQSMSTVMAGAAGVASLFGGEQEKMNELMQKTVALIAIANAAQTAADFTKQNAIGIYIKDKTKEIAVRIKEALTIKSVTAATTAETAAKGKSSIATKTIITLQNLWNKTLKASPIFILIGVIAAVTAGVVLLANAFSRSKKEMDSVAESAEALSKAYDKLTDSHNYELSMLRALGAESKGVQQERIRQIEDEIKALEESREKYQQLSTETKTFGFGLTERAKEAQEKFKEINDSIIKLEREKNIAIAELNTAAAEEEKKRLDEQNAERLKKQQEANAIAIREQKIANEKMANATIKKLEPISAKINVEFELPSTEEMLADLDFSPLEQKGIEISQMLSQAVEAGMENMIASMSEAIGLLASGEADMGDVFRIIGEQVANFADALGKALIAAGVASKAFQTLFANPFAAIAAGAALVATAAIVRAKLKAGVSGSGSGGGGAGVATYSAASSERTSSEWQSRSVNVNQQNIVVTGTIRASGTELVTVIENENRRKGY